MSPLKCKFLRFVSAQVKKSVKFLISILKRQVSSSSNFASFFIAMIQNSSVNSKFIHFLTFSNFETFECSGENLPNFSFHFSNQKSVILQILHLSPLSLNITSLCFLTQTLYTLAKSSPLKCKFLRLSSAQVKIHQIPHVNFETGSQFFFKISAFFSFITHNSSVKF